MKTVTRAPLGAVCIVAVALTLAACSSPAPEPSATTTSGSQTTSPTSQPTQEVVGDSIPYEQNCDDLMPASVMYGWNPNYSLNNSASPATGSSWDTVTELKGTNCNFVNQSSGNSLSISVAQLTDSGVSVLQNQIASTLSQVSGDDQGTIYFGTIAGSGVFEMFVTNKFWITIAGPDIASVDDVAVLKQQILQYLPWG